MDRQTDARPMCFNPAHMITIVRIALAPALVACELARLDPLVCTLFAVAALTDLTDGPLARSHSAPNHFGMMLDIIADFIVIETMFVLLCVSGSISPFPTVFAAISFAVFVFRGVEEPVRTNEIVFGKFAGTVCYAGLIVFLLVRAIVPAASPVLNITSIIVQILVSVYLAAATGETIMRAVRRSRTSVGR